MSSICCKAPTRIGYYNATKRPDIHGIIGNMVVVGVMGTYCTQCGNLCDFTDNQGNEYYTNGLKKNSNEKISNYTENYIS